MTRKYRLSLNDILGVFCQLRSTWKLMHGCVVRTWGTSDTEKWVRGMLASGGSRKEVEVTCNHNHVGMLIDCMVPGTSYEEEDERTVADVVVALALFDLKRAFPDREFFSEVFEEDDYLTVAVFQTGNELDAEEGD